jgi:hypothetical protein
MSEQRDALPLDTLVPLATELEPPVLHPLAGCARVVRKCICAGGEIPFYCPAHGRVENPNWPLLKWRDQ